MSLPDARLSLVTLGVERDLGDHAQREQTLRAAAPAQRPGSQGREQDGAGTVYKGTLSL